MSPTHFINMSSNGWKLMKWEQKTFREFFFVHCTREVSNQPISNIQYSLKSDESSLRLSLRKNVRIFSLVGDFSYWILSILYVRFSVRTKVAQNPLFERLIFPAEGVGRSIKTWIGLTLNDISDRWYWSPTHVRECFKYFQWKLSQVEHKPCW